MIRLSGMSIQLASSLRRAGAIHEARGLYHDPVEWLDRYVDWPANTSLADYQQEIIAGIPVHKRQAVRGPHGLGKSALASLTTLWFGCTREVAGVDWKVVTTATAWRHLTIYLWPEIHKWIARVKWDELGIPRPRPRAELLDLRLKLTHGAASAIASDDPVNLEGAHADSILYIFDEAKAIPVETWDAAEGALSGDGGDDDTPMEAFALAISTPGAPSGRFFEIHAKRPGLDDWHARHVTLEEAVKAKRISRQWAERRKIQWGENSAIYRNRVLGEFHAQDDEATIPLEWVEQANLRWREWDENNRPIEAAKVLGVDVARSGKDFSALAHRYGDVIEKVERRRFTDTMRTASEVLRHMDGTTKAVVDVIGIGAGVVDRLRELKQRVIPFTGSGKSKSRDRSREFGFANRRSEAWWHMRELLDPSNDSNIALPDDDQLTGDLCAPRWDVKSGVPPKIQIEPKDKLVVRIGRSPDVGDAVVMAYFVDKVKGQVEYAKVPGAQERQTEKAEQIKKQRQEQGHTDGKRRAPPINTKPRRRGVLSLSPLDKGFRVFR